MAEMSALLSSRDCAGLHVHICAKLRSSSSEVWKDAPLSKVKGCIGSAHTFVQVSVHRVDVRV